MGQSSWLPALLQLSDSQLPIGAYAHSLGFEGLVQLDAIGDVEGLEQFMKRELLSSLSEVDLPILRHAREALADDDRSRLARLDQLALATRPSSELRSASSRMGRQLVQLAPRILGSEAGRIREWESLLECLPERQSVTVTALLHHLQGVPTEAGLQAYAYQALTGVAQAGLKLLHLGPFAIQGILGSCGEAVEGAVARALAFEEDEIGSFSPLWDIASARHERAPARLFIS